MGLSIGFPRFHPKMILDQSLNIGASWSYQNFNQYQLWVLTLDLKNSKLVNRDILNVSMQNVFYNGNKFTRFNQKIYEVTLSHSTEYSFAEFAKVTATLTSVFESVCRSQSGCDLQRCAESHILYTGFWNYDLVQCVV